MIGRWIFIRDNRLSRRGWIVLVVLAVLALLAMVPLRLVLGMADPSGRTLRAQAVEGPAWDGLAGELQVGRLTLGLMEMDLMPLPLLLGRAQFALERPDYPGAVPLSARVRGSGGNIVISGATGEVPLSGMLAPLPVRALSLNGFNAEMSAGACVSASGTLGVIVPALGSVMPAETVLAGEARCEDGALVVPMVGPSGAERIDFRLTGDGQWTASMALVGLPAELAGPLTEMGFTSRKNGMGLTASGTL